VEEVKVAWEILKATGLRKKGFNMIACPSCGRADVEIVDLAGQVEERLQRDYGNEVMEIAVMGCAVNGPGEAGNADFGIAGGRHVGFLYAHGEVLRKVPQAELVDELFREIDAWIAAGKPDNRQKDAFGKREVAEAIAADGPRVTMVGAAE
jgi:(E)-4-hydroxy-3-methylbut-2-enyl-diphosphate synthase